MGAFDQTIIEALVSVGVSRDRAQSVADLLERRIDERYSLHAQILVSKCDLADVEVKLVRDMASHAERVNEQFAQVQERISRSSEQIAERFAQAGIAIAEAKSETIKWMCGALVAQSALVLGAAKLMF